MTEIQFGSGSSSSNTHHIVQPSKTLNRRYVSRPSNLAIEEAAQTISRERESIDSVPTSARPSRLVNLRVHAADLLAAEQAESAPTEQNNHINDEPILPHIVEFGTSEATSDLSKVVPPEETAVDYNATSNEPTMAVMTIASTSIVSTPEPAQDLAMNIAADYAAANLDASANANSNDTIDTIARAASEAIAAVRSASDPTEIAEQVASLKTFADNIKASSSAPEMMELSDTIEKFVGIAMKSSRVQEEVERKLREEEAAKERSKALARSHTNRPAITAKKAAPVKRTTITKPSTNRTVTKPIAKSPAKLAKPVARKPLKPAAKSKVAANEDAALRKALRSVASMEDETEQPLKNKVAKRKTGKKRFVLAFFCALACVGAVVYFVAANIPDISVKVAAMQTGIEASYPTYVPRDFSLSDISSENGKITLSFKGPQKAAFTITEEKSSWDSTALLRNFVEPTWQSNYITTHEQGLTIYISGSNAAWVNGGVLYKITTTSNDLTKKQLRNIVTSM